AEKSDGRPSPWERGEAVRRAFLEPRRPIVTFTLILLNVLVFLAGVAWAIQKKAPVGKYLTGANDAQAVEIVHDIGALHYSDFLKDEWWRLLSAAFVHIGLLHLFLNMYFLYSIGPIMEMLFGPVRFVGL